VRQFNWPVVCGLWILPLFLCGLEFVWLQIVALVSATKGKTREKHSPCDETFSLTKRAQFTARRPTSRNPSVAAPIGGLDPPHRQILNTGLCIAIVPTHCLPRPVRRGVEAGVSASTLLCQHSTVKQSLCKDNFSDTCCQVAMVFSQQIRVGEHTHLACER